MSSLLDRLDESRKCCRNPQPRRYLSTEIKRGRYYELYECDSCKKTCYVEARK